MKIVYRERLKKNQAEIRAESKFAGFLAAASFAVCHPLRFQTEGFWHAAQATDFQSEVVL